MLIDLCFRHSVNSTILTVQCSHFLFLSVHDPKISTTLERIAQIYLPYLPLFASLDDDDNDDDDDDGDDDDEEEDDNDDDDDDHLEWRADC